MDHSSRATVPSLPPNKFTFTPGLNRSNTAESSASAASTPTSSKHPPPPPPSYSYSRSSTSSSLRPANNKPTTHTHLIKSSPTVNVYTTCGRHTDQLLFGGPSLKDLARSIRNKF